MVSVDGIVIFKFVQKVFSIVCIDVDDLVVGYVFWVVLKLFEGLFVFGIDLKEWICLDIGVFIGGFIQVFLEWGVVKVYVIDVGYDQFYDSLCVDFWVIVQDGVNVWDLILDYFDFDWLDLLVFDVSFILFKFVFFFVFDLVVFGVVGVFLVKL